MYKPYDKVWVMENNKPTEKLVYAVVEECAGIRYQQTQFYLLLVDSLACSHDRNKPYYLDKVFLDKQSLINSL